MGTQPTALRARSARVGLVALLAGAAVVAACGPQPGGGSPTTTTTTIVTEPRPPVIHSFTQRGATGGAPALVTLAWEVSDPNGDPLTCRIDGDGDGTYDLTVTNCQVPGSRNFPVDSPGPHQARLEVRDGDHDPVTATRAFVVTADVGEPMDIELRGLEDLDPAIAQAFTDAAARWESVIVRGLPDYVPSSPRPSCLPEDVDPLPAVLDDVIVDVATPVIDGPGEVLGQAGPTCVLSTTELGIHGIIEIDLADAAQMLANGSLGEVIEHELGHVLGIGTLWDTSWMQQGQRRLLQGSGTSNPTYRGAAGVAEWSAFGRSGNVPVENSGGPGTAEAHWRETTFHNELMTGYVNWPPNPMSRLTIGSLADLGYRVDIHAADAYSLPGAVARLRQQPAPEGDWERPPVGTAD